MSKKISKAERRAALRKSMEDDVKKDGNKFSVLNLEGHEDVVFFKPKDGKNRVDILPYVVKTKNHPSGIKPGYLDYKLEIYQHTNVGTKDETILCPKKLNGKACPICEESKKAYDDKDKKLGGDLAPKRRTIYNIVDLNDDNYDGIKLWDVTWHWVQKYLIKLIAEEDGIKGTSTPFDHEEGNTIKFRGSKEAYEGNDYIDVINVEIDDREDQYSDDILDLTYSLDAMMKDVLTYEEIEKKFYGGEGDEETEEEEEVEGKLTRKKKTKLEEKHPDYDEVPLEEAEEEEKPKRGRKKKESSGCPEGYEFGKEHDGYDDCADCEETRFDACEEENDKLRKAKRKSRK